ncbi:MAG: hypothetical protein IJO44_07280 [Clostridia bacterium]|nr:hypothetical protein [Clostridia bacterium]
MKKLIIILISCVLVTLAAFGAYKLWYIPVYCDIEIVISKPVEATDKYFENYHLAYNHIPESKNWMIAEIVEKNNAFRMDFFDKYKEDNFHIMVDAKIENGKTIITYHGNITDSETGKTEDFKEDLVFDFVLAEKVSNLS